MAAAYTEGREAEGEEESGGGFGDNAFEGQIVVRLPICRRCDLSIAVAGTAIEYHASIKDGVFRETELIRLSVLSKSSISPPTGHIDAKLPVSGYDFRIRKGDDVSRLG